MKAVIKLDVPDFQIDQPVTVYFKDTMQKTGVCEADRNEPVAAEIEGGGASWFHVCGDCHGSINWKDSYCCHCGRKVKWE